MLFILESENCVTQKSHELNYRKLGRELMSQDELAVIEGLNFFNLNEQDHSLVINMILQNILVINI